MDILKKHAPIFIVILLSLLSIRFLFEPGYFPMHDDTQPTRVFEMYQALTDGQFPVRWVDDLGYGYGYPIFNFYAPLSYYVGAGFMFLGMDAINATKMLFIIGAIGSSISMYILGSYLWGKWGGIISSLLYVFLPYHAVQLFVRGALGEYIAYVFLPLIIFGILKTHKNLKTGGMIISGLGLAGVILSHNISGMLVLAMLCIWLGLESVNVLIGHKNDNFLYPIIMTMLLGVSITTFFWLPALVETRLTRAETLVAGTNNFRDHFVYPDQLWDSPWGYAGSAEGRLDGMSFKLGKLHIILALWGMLGLFLSRYFKIILKTLNDHVKWLVCVGAGISIFMMLPISIIVWNIFPFLAYVQYPWRLLAFSGFFLSIAGGSIVKTMESKNKRNWIFVGLAMAIIFLNLKHFRPNFISEKNLFYYTDENQIKWTISKISDEYLPSNFHIPQNESEIRESWIEGGTNVEILSIDRRTHFAKVLVSAAEQTNITYRQVMFPGWRAAVDTKQATIKDDRGLIKLTVPSGEHLVTIYFENTLVRSIANMISLASILIFSAWSFGCWKNLQIARK